MRVISRLHSLALFCGNSILNKDHRESGEEVECLIECNRKNLVKVREREIDGGGKGDSISAL